MFKVFNDEGSLRCVAVRKGRLCTEVNDASDFVYEDLDYSFYIEEAYKLMEPFSETDTQMSLF